MKQLPQPDPRGWLAFTGLDKKQQAAEDATQYADHENYWHNQGGFSYQYSQQDGCELRVLERDATATERELLTSLGHHVPEELTTSVHMRAHGVRFRFWPQLEEQQEGD
ncbi:MAG: hypothetical protein Q4E11_07550 [Corynebacterium sp.]|uniref:hypothetical protein n=1 Tax=Corynebacterium sp. TaxID=1720 RepID=UPI0026DD2FB7|nr:hypothetical protein [Corynebacterium sp.]MDO5030422.1 hypothetical protein [Corynebacterium sp.]